MDIKVAREVSILSGRCDSLRSSIMTMRSRMEEGPFGTVNLTVPASWLPTIIGLAESELAELEEKISKI